MVSMLHKIVKQQIKVHTLLVKQNILLKQNDYALKLLWLKVNR